MLHFYNHHNNLIVSLLLNTSKCLIRGLIPFKYRNICESCDILTGKDKKGRIMAKKCFVLHEEVTDFFYEMFYITTIEKLSFHLAHVRILGSTECGNTRNDCFRANTSKNNIKFKKDYAEKSSEATGIEIQSQHWGGNRK